LQDSIFDIRVGLSVPWHLPSGYYGEEFPDETIVHHPDGSASRLVGPEAAAWRAASKGEPFAEHLADRLASMGLLVAKEGHADDAPGGELSALPEDVTVPPHVRWRREGVGAIYIVNTSWKLRSYWLTEPLATFWETLATLGPRAAHRRTTARFGRNWRLADSVSFLGELSRAGLVLGSVPDSQAQLPAKLPTQPDVESVSNRLRWAPIPWYLLWEITYACNLRCLTCYATELYNKRVPSVKQKQAEQMIADIVRANVFHVTLIGGEPFAQPLLPDICAELKRNNIYTKIVSNGTLITDEMATRLADVGVNQIDVSVDGFDGETNDPVRGEGSFVDIQKGVRAVLQSGIPWVSLSLTAGGHNFPTVQDLPRLAKETFGVNTVFLTRFICSGNARGVQGWQMSPEQLTELRRLIDVEWPVTHPDMKVWTQRWQCDCGRTRCVVSPEGKLRTCTFHGNIVGQSVPGDLLAEWQQAEGFDMVRRPYRYNSLCSSCDEQLVCRGSACSSRVFARDKTMISSGCIHDETHAQHYGA
jgi:radical SAM protein with 4Fe4S-binding SPASM domain